MQRDDEIKMETSLKYNDPEDMLTEQALKVQRDEVQRNKNNEIQFWVMIVIFLGLLAVIPYVFNKW